MKGLLFFLIAMSIFNYSITAQEIEAALANEDTSSGFLIKDTDSKTLFDVRGNGNVGVGVRNTNFLFEVRNPFYGSTDNQIGRNISLNAEHQYYGGSAGSLFLSAGNMIGGMESGSGSSLVLHGGSGDEGGGIDITTGIGSYLPGGGDINITTGGAYDGGNGGSFLLETGFSGFGKSGDILLKTGMGGVLSGEIKLETGIGDYGSGDISLIAGGNVNLSPGIDDGGSNNGIVEVTGSGTVSGDWTVASDKRYKKNIKDLDEPVENIYELQPVKYEFRVDEFPEKHFEAGEKIGLIAQEVEKLIPQLVRTNQEGYKSVDYSKLSVVLLEALKEQQKEITELKDLILKLSDSK